LEVLRFFTEKGADVSVRDTTNNSVVHFPAVSYSVDIVKLLLGTRTSVKLTNLNVENPQHISAGCGNLEARKTVVEKRVALNDAKKYGVSLLMVIAQSGKM
jgi:ankyrin repeat protein